jgi:hypothetical protein
MRMISLLGQVAAPTVAEADSGGSGADGPPGPDQSPYARGRPAEKWAQTAGFARGSIGDLLPLSLKRESHRGKGGSRLGAPHDVGVPSGGAGRAAVLRPPGVTWGRCPPRCPPPGCSASWRSGPPQITHFRRVRLGVPDHIGQRLAQRGHRVIAELPGNHAVQRANQRALGLESERRPSTGKEASPMSSDFDPLQAWPKPVQTPYPPNGRR